MARGNDHNKYAYESVSGVVKKGRGGPRGVAAAPGVAPLDSVDGFGSRARVDSTEDLQEMLKAHRAAEARAQKRGDVSKSTGGRVSIESALGLDSAPGSILEATETSATGYKPTNASTREAYSVLLDIIRRLLESDYGTDVLEATADEVLRECKAPGRSDSSRRKALGALLSSTGEVSEVQFRNLMKLSQAFVDWRDPDAQDDDDDDDMMMGGRGAGEAHIENIVDGDESDDKYNAIIVSDSDSDESDDEEAIVVQGAGIEAEEEDDEDGSFLPESAHWLQDLCGRLTSEDGDQADDSAEKSRALAARVFASLSDFSLSTYQVEESIHRMLPRNQETTLLVNHRWAIVYGIRFHRATTTAAMDALEKEMSAGAELSGLLERLKEGDYGHGAIRSRASSTKTKMVRMKAKEHTVDLESLAFSEGSRLNTGGKFLLPPNSVKTQGKGWVEVAIPPPKKPAAAINQKLVYMEELPEWARPAFGSIKSLNVLQSKVYDTAFSKVDNMLVCAPTGAGKTNVAMLTVLQEIGKHRKDNASRGDTRSDLSAFKVVYIAPMKSLVQEMVGSFRKRLAPYNVTVGELTGDSSLTRAQIDETNIIVTTPEKWDIVTRKAGEQTYTELVRLVIVDEIHLLHDSRGPILESIIARTIRRVEASGVMTRIVGLSATLPNYRDVQRFLRVPESGLFYLDGSYRPVPLEQHYIGVTERAARKRGQMMNQICYERVMQHAGSNQVLVFVHSRRDTVATARYMRDQAAANEVLGKFVREDGRARAILDEEIASGNVDSVLADLLSNGFACHHAGMSKDDRSLVEDLFASGCVQVLVSTATLAWGVNLPAHAVIIKGTQVYSPEKGKWTELSFMDVMQMLGRAGRPAFDTLGHGTVITTHQELEYYLSLINEALPVESQLISRLSDSLNAEVVLGTVRSMREAIAWLGYTYLFVRAMVKPELYGLPDGVGDDEVLLEWRRNLIHAAATKLSDARLISYDRRSGHMSSLPLGRISSHYYVSHNTMAMFHRSLTPDVGEIDLLRIFSQADEFTNVSVRTEEEQELKKLLERVPIPVKEKKDAPTAKVNALLQAYISRLRLEGFVIASDMVYITQSAGRLLRAMLEVAVQRGFAGVAERALAISRCVHSRMWEAQTPLRQFPRVPGDVIRALEARYLEWDRVCDLEAPELGELVRTPDLGESVYAVVHRVPRLELDASVYPITRSLLRIDLNILPNFEWDAEEHGSCQMFHVWVEGPNGESFLHHEKWNLRESGASSEHTLTIYVPVLDPLPPMYFIRVSSDLWLGSDALLPISLRRMILPRQFPAPTELLDMLPHPVASLQVPSFVAAFKGRFSHFNAVQTQAFDALYGGSSSRSNSSSGKGSVLVCAPAGSGRSVCHELALLRHVADTTASGQPPKAVVLLPTRQGVERRLKQWKAIYGEGGSSGLNLSLVGCYGDDLVGDARTSAQANVTLTTPATWEALSRGWRENENVHSVGLVLAADLHRVGDAVEGPVYETVLMRMRYMGHVVAGELGLPEGESSLRVVATASCIANANDFKSWLNLSSVFNFPADARAVAMDLKVVSQPHSSPHGRFLATHRAAWSSINRCCPRADPGPVLAFTASGKQAKEAADALITLADSNRQPNRFIFASQEDLDPLLRKFNSQALARRVACGVGYVDAHTSSRDRALLLHLHSSGAIQVLVAGGGSEVCDLLGGAARSKLVLVLTTQRYEGREHGHVDVRVAEMLQWVGMAGRQGVDSTCWVEVFAPASKVEFFRKFIRQPLPVESHLDSELPENFNADIVAEVMDCRQDMVDYLSRSLLYRRLKKNPNFYNISANTHTHIMDYFSQLVQGTVETLAVAGCVEEEEAQEGGGGGKIVATSFADIAAHHGVKVATVSVFAGSVKAGTKLSGLLEILAASLEFADLPIREREETMLSKLANHLPIALPKDSQFNNPHTKAFVLLQAQMSRVSLPGGGWLQNDLNSILRMVPRLTSAMVDVVSAMQWLSPALACMELAQMLTQATWSGSSPLLQLPHVDEEAVKRASRVGIVGVEDVAEAEDEAREAAFPLDEDSLEELAEACNRYPSVDVAYGWKHKTDEAPASGSRVVLQVKITREVDEDSDDEGSDDEEEIPGPVIAPFFPGSRREGWWVVLGDETTNSILGLRSINNLEKAKKIKLKVDAPSSVGDHNLKLYLMCDSYLGVDQEFQVPLSVGSASMLVE